MSFKLILWATIGICAAFALVLFGSYAMARAAKHVQISYGTLIVLAGGFAVISLMVFMAGNWMVIEERQERRKANEVDFKNIWIK